LSTTSSVCGRVPEDGEPLRVPWEDLTRSPAGRGDKGDSRFLFFFSFLFSLFSPVKTASFFEVIMQPPTNPLPPDCKSKDKFLIQWIPITAAEEAQEPAELVFPQLLSQLLSLPRASQYILFL